MGTADYVVETAKKYNPLSAPWWVALVQGLVAAGLGILLLLFPRQAADALAPFLALYILIHGLFEIAAGTNKERTTTAMQIAYYRGIVGAAIGGVLLSLFFLGVLSRETGIFWLGIGLLLYGLGGLYLAFARGSGNGRILSLIGAVLFIILGAIGIWGRFSETVPLFELVSWTLVVLGLGLVVVAFVRRSNSAAEDAAPAKVPVG
jgi:uncharacterized membrane protein HdeD (DUF308 family)